MNSTLPFPLSETRIGPLTVSELNASIKLLLESTYCPIWVEGEISNARIAASQHCFFTLKDSGSQIGAVIFKGQSRKLRFALENGLQVICMGRIGVYEPRGEYRVIVDVVEPKGIGALQLAFEQLKQKLMKEGLFDSAAKRGLPFCPQRVAVVTSPSGAVIRDIVETLKRSPYPVTVSLLPVRVQGENAAGEIAAAIKQANSLQSRMGFDLLIVARGGGSLEDLWAFNEESVARAVSDSKIPLISAVGHETDTTISDMVADLRCPTPTAAAEWVVNRMTALEREIESRREQLQHFLIQKVNGQLSIIENLGKRVVHPSRRLEELRQHVSHRIERLCFSFSRRTEVLRMKQNHLAERLWALYPGRTVENNRAALARGGYELSLHFNRGMESRQIKLRGLAERLEGLSPLAVLLRGYAIAYKMPEKVILRSAGDVHPGESLLVRLSEGSVFCRVEDQLNDYEKGEEGGKEEMRSLRGGLEQASGHSGADGEGQSSTGGFG